MASLNDNLIRLSDARDDIISAISEMGGTVSNLDGFEDFPDDIRSIPTGSPSVLDKLKEIEIVRFFDWDGTLLHKYTKDEFLALDSLPENPNNPNMISQGWNWTLSDAKDYVQTYGMLDIGQYAKWDWNSIATQDQLNGITTINFDVTDKSNRYHVQLGLDEGSSMSIDFGDGTEIVTTTSSSASHYYNAVGNYTIKIQVSGTFHLINRSSTTQNILYYYKNSSYYFLRYNSIEFGYNLTALSDSAFSSQSTITSVILPPSVTTLPINAFSGCESLTDIKLTGDITSMSSGTFKNVPIKNIAIPSSLTTISGYTTGLDFMDSSIEYITFPNISSYMPISCFQRAYRLRNISLSNTTKTYTTCFSACPNLEAVTTNQPFYCANVLTSLEKVSYPSIGGTHAYYVIIPKFTVCKNTNIYNCGETLVLRNTDSTSVSFTINSSSTGNLEQYLKCLIIDSSNVTTLSLTSLQALKEIRFGNNSITSISINNCYGVEYIDIPMSYTNIDSSMISNFFNSAHLTTIKFMNSTPPTLASQFTPARNDLKIYIPQGSLSAYTSATNYPSTDVCEYIEY